MENYEKKYKEVLEKAKALYKASEPMSGCNVILEILFPELKESEDEKVRKELIKHLKELSDWKEDEVIPVKNSSYYRQWASWLEKQGEKKSTWTDNDRTMAFTLLRDVDQMTYISKEGKDERLEWLNSLDDRFKKE